MVFLSSWYERVSHHVYHEQAYPIADTLEQDDEHPDQTDKPHVELKLRTHVYRQGTNGKWYMRRTDSGEGCWNCNDDDGYEVRADSGIGEPAYTYLCDRCLDNETVTA